MWRQQLACQHVCEFVLGRRSAKRYCGSSGAPPKTMLVLPAATGVECVVITVDGWHRSRLFAFIHHLSHSLTLLAVQLPVFVVQRLSLHQNAYDAHIIELVPCHTLLRAPCRLSPHHIRLKMVLQTAWLLLARHTGCISSGLLPALASVCQRPSRAAGGLLGTSATPNADAVSLSGAASTSSSRSVHSSATASFPQYGERAV